MRAFRLRGLILIGGGVRLWLMNTSDTNTNTTAVTLTLTLMTGEALRAGKACAEDLADAVEAAIPPVVVQAWDECLGPLIKGNEGASAECLTFGLGGAVQARGVTSHCVTSY